MRYINKFIFVFLVIACCIDVTFSSKVEGFDHFLLLDYSDKHVEELLKSNTEEILNKFLRFVEFDEDAKKSKSPTNSQN